MYGHCGSAATDLVFGGFSDCISLMKQQFIITPTHCQCEIPALLDSWVKNTPVKMLCPQKNLFLYFHKNTNTLTCWSIKGLCSFFSLSLCPMELCIGGLQQIAVSRVA
jgi:hypothetical protein